MAGKSAAGAVDLRSFDKTASRFSMATLAGTGGAVTGARFGSSVVVQDMNRDGCEDLLVGAPGGATGNGAVYLALGTSAGVQPTGATRITAPDGVAGDEFGASIATSRVYNDGSADLWIGAPGATAAGKAEAGKVYHYLVSAAGVASYVDAFSYASLAVLGLARAGDRFGSVLADGEGGVVVGVPHRNVNGRPDAGEVVFLLQVGTGAASARVDSQDSPGVAGVAEAGDEFGASVSVEIQEGKLVAVGVPGEDIGPARDAGGVELFSGVTPLHAYNQSSPGVPGVNETGDRFGAAVAVLGDEQCFTGEVKSETIAAGAPGEAIGTVKQAGAVTRFRAGELCGPKLYFQGGTLPNRAEAGDHVGATLATLKADEFHTATFPTDQFLIGDPGEDGAKLNSGAVQRSFPVGSYGAIGGPVAGLAYGTVLGIAGRGDIFFPH